MEETKMTEQEANAKLADYVTVVKNALIEATDLIRKYPEYNLSIDINMDISLDDDQPIPSSWESLSEL